MPMLLSEVDKKERFVGFLQLANSDKQQPFTDDDIEIIRLFSRKLSRYLHESKVQTQTSVLFKKQLEVSILNSSLENQTVSTVLTLANKLFSSKNTRDAGERP